MHSNRMDRCHNSTSINSLRNNLLACVVHCHIKYSYFFIVTNLITKRIVRVFPWNNEMTIDPWTKVIIRVIHGHVPQGPRKIKEIRKISKRLNWTSKKKRQKTKTTKLIYSIMAVIVCQKRILYGTNEMK